MKISSFVPVFLAATGIVLVSSAAAEAASFTKFDLRGYDSRQSSFVYTSQDGITLKVTATDENGGSRNVVRSSTFGLGVTIGGDRAVNGTRTQIDGRGANEILNLDFGQNVKLISAKFGLVDSNDEYELFVDGDYLTGDAFPRNGSPTVNFTNINPSDRTGTVIAFTVNDRNDDYYLKKVKVEKVYPAPEPFSILGAGMALGFGVLCKHEYDKKHQKAKTIV